MIAQHCNVKFCVNMHRSLLGLKYWTSSPYTGSMYSLLLSCSFAWCGCYVKLGFLRKEVECAAAFTLHKVDSTQESWVDRCALWEWGPWYSIWVIQYSPSKFKDVLALARVIGLLQQWIGIPKMLQTDMMQAVWNFWLLLHLISYYASPLALALNLGMSAEGLPVLVKFIASR